MKKTIAMLLAVVMLFALCACGNTTPAQPAADSGAANSTPAAAPAPAESTPAPASAPASTTTWEMVTGSSGGAWFNTAAALAELVNNDNRGLIIKVLPGAGTANPAAIGAGEANCGWVYPVNAISAIEGVDPYDQAYPDLCSVVGGFSMQYCMFATTEKSGITDVAEALTSGKPIRILTNTRTSVTGWLLTKILDFYGTSVEDIEKAGGQVTFTGYTDWPQLVQDGHVDLMFEHSTLPSTAFQEILTSRKLVFLDTPADLIDYIKDSYDYVDCTVPAGTYEGVAEDIPSMGTQNLFAVNRNVSDEAVIALLDCMEQNEADIQAIHPSWAGWTIANGWKSLGAPLHPAAEQWYKDHGYMQ